MNHTAYASPIVFARAIRGAILAVLMSGFHAASALAQGSTQLISLTNTWRFHDQGIDLGTAWSAKNYPAEGSWPMGRALLGIESTTPYPYPMPIQTSLVLGGGRITYYFRTHFNVVDHPGTLLLTSTNYIDDGAVFYLNGAEAARVRMPAGSISYTNRAHLASPEGVPVLLSLPNTNLVQGDNVLAVEVHQNSSTSSDVVFGLSLHSTAAIRPGIVDAAEPANRAVLQGRSTTLSITATGSPPPTYQWYKGNSARAGATDSSLVLTNFRSLDAGNYFVVASNFVGMATSRTSVVSYVPDTNPPAILYTLGQADLTKILAVFTEPPDPDLREAEDEFNWLVMSADGGSLDVASAMLINATNVIITTIQPRDPAVPYLVKTSTDIHDPYGNALPGGATVPMAWFETPLATLDGAQSWRYDASGVAPGIDWTNRAFADGAWAMGAPVLDAAAPCRSVLPANGEIVRTCFSLSNAANTAQIPTAYFRTHFQFDGDAAHTVLRLRGLIDDGAVFYLNGAELARWGMPTGAVTHTTLASRSIGDAYYEDIQISAPGLVQGDNVLSVEVHQDSLTSPDLTFGLRVIGVVPALTMRPRLDIQRSGDNVVITWTPATGTLQEADEVTGPWLNLAPSHPPNQHITTVSGAPRKFYQVTVP